MATKAETEKIIELLEATGFNGLAKDLRSHRYTAEETLRHLLNRRFPLAPNSPFRPLIQKALDTIDPPRTHAIFRGSEYKG